jgi:hypothetical protein
MKRLITLILLSASLAGGCHRKRDRSAAPSPGWFIPDAPGTRTIVARGGRGTNGAGGTGGGVTANNINGADVYILRNGTINTAFSMPATLPRLGSNPRTITADTTITVGTGLTAGSRTILGDDGLTAATGLWVAPGVTLSLGPNHDTDNADLDGNTATGTLEDVQLDVTDGVIIEGTVRALLKDFSANTANFFIECGNFAALENSVIDTRGSVSDLGGPGYDGGFLWIDCFGTIRAHGELLSGGGEGDTDGGDAGFVRLQSFFWDIYHTGTLDSGGGFANNGVGGNGGAVTLWFSSAAGSFTGGGLFNTGTIRTGGANGTLGGGNAGGVDTFGAGNSDGPLVQNGDIDASGGRALVNGTGGNGANIILVGWGAPIRAVGQMTARGGHGAGAGNGGNGAQINVSTNSSANQPGATGNYISVGADSSGGDGAVGGNAGPIFFWNNTNHGGAITIPDSSPTYLVGILSMDTTGGNGTTSGGNGGAVSLNLQPAIDPGGQPFYGSLTSEPSILSRGGNATAGAGGVGGAVFFGDLGTTPQQTTPDYNRTTTNTGGVITRGGNGTTTGGAGGAVTVFSRYNARNEGAIDASGGLSGSGTAGAGGAISVSSENVTVNLANLTSDGGTSTANAGANGGTIKVDGRYATHAGIVVARGGHSVGVAGANGGTVHISSYDGQVLSVVSGSASVPFGTGTPNGTAGTVFVDGVVIAQSNGTVNF